MENQNDQRDYRMILSEAWVSVKVPKESQYMEQIKAHEFQLKDKTVSVREHWRNSFLVPGTSQIIQRNFFDITKDDLGKKIVATVEVIEKTTSRGRKVMLLNIFKNYAQKAMSELKFSSQGNGISLPDTDIKIIIQAR